MCPYNNHKYSHHEEPCCNHKYSHHEEPCCNECCSPHKYSHHEEPCCNECCPPPRCIPPGCPPPGCPPLPPYCPPPCPSLCPFSSTLTNPLVYIFTLVLIPIHLTLPQIHIDTILNTGSIDNIPTITPLDSILIAPFVTVTRYTPKNVLLGGKIGGVLATLKIGPYGRLLTIKLSQGGVPPIDTKKVNPLAIYTLPIYNERPRTIHLGDTSYILFVKQINIGGGNSCHNNPCYNPYSNYNPYFGNI